MVREVVSSLCPVDQRCSLHLLLGALLLVKKICLLHKTILAPRLRLSKPPLIFHQKAPGTWPLVVLGALSVQSEKVASVWWGGSAWGPIRKRTALREFFCYCPGLL